MSFIRLELNVLSGFRRHQNLLSHLKIFPSYFLFLLDYEMSPISLNVHGRILRTINGKKENVYTWNYAGMERVLAQRESGIGCSGAVQSRAPPRPEEPFTETFLGLPQLPNCVNDLPGVKGAAAGVPFTLLGARG